MELSNIRRRALATAAHHLKPIVQIGKDGLSATAISGIMEAFNTRELLKVKALETCPDDRGALGEKLAALPEVTLVRNIGHVYILYRPLPEAPPTPAPAAPAPRARPTAKPAKKSRPVAARPTPPRRAPRDPEPKGFRRSR